LSVTTSLIVFATARVPSLVAADNEAICEAILRLCECDQVSCARISEPCDVPTDLDDLEYTSEPLAAIPEALREKRVVSLLPRVGPLFHELAGAIDVPLLGANAGYCDTSLWLGRHIHTFDWREEIGDPGRRSIETDVAFCLFGYGTPEYKRYWQSAHRSETLANFRNRLSTLIGPVDIELRMSW